MKTSATRNETIVIGMVHKSEEKCIRHALTHIDIVLIALTYDCTGWMPTLLHSNQVTCEEDSITVDTNC